MVDWHGAQKVRDAILGYGNFSNDEAGEQEGFVGEVMDVVGFVDPGVGDDAVGVGADGGLDVVFVGGQDAGQGLGGGDVLGTGEEGVVVGIRVSGESVEGEMQAGFVPHAGGFERFEGGGGGGGVGERRWGVGVGVGVGMGNEGVVVWVWVTGTWNGYA